MAVFNEIGLVISWVEKHCPAISDVHIPEVDCWEADFFSRCGSQGEWSLHPEILNLLSEMGDMRCEHADLRLQQ